MNRLNVVVADSSPLYRLGFKILLDNARANVEEADSYDGLKHQLGVGGKADVVIVDSKLSGLAHLTQLSEISRQHATMVVVDSNHHRLTAQLEACGVKAVILKSATQQEFCSAVREVRLGSVWFPPADSLAQGLSGLTRSERRIATLVGQGLLNKQIAYRLERSESTIKRHLSNIYRKVGIKNRSALAMAMMDHCDRHSLST